MKDLSAFSGPSAETSSSLLSKSACHSWLFPLLGEDKVGWEPLGKHPTVIRVSCHRHLPRVTLQTVIGIQHVTVLKDAVY